MPLLLWWWWWWWLCAVIVAWTKAENVEARIEVIGVVATFWNLYL
jgi:hypothetical protein